MNITVSFRQMAASVATRRYAQDKIGKLQKFLRQPLTAKVTLSLERLGSQKLRYVAETRLASGGRRIDARAESEDMYASVDEMIDKLERRISDTKGVAQAKARRGGATLRGGSKPRPVEPAAVLPEVAKPVTKKTKPAKSKPRAAAAPVKAKAKRASPERGRKK